MQILLPLALVCLLTACGGLTSARPAVAPCLLPEVLPARALSDQEIELLWGRDRTALRNCGERLAVSLGGR